MGIDLLSKKGKPGRKTFGFGLGAMVLLLSLFLVGVVSASDAFLFVDDDGGVDQIDNNAGGQQSDLTRFGIDNTHVATDGFLWLQWNWDRIDFT